MKTKYKKEIFEFQGMASQKVQSDFSGGQITSDAGCLLLRAVNQSIGLTNGFAQCFEDGRDQRYVEHTLEQLLSQRFFGITLGYEDINDHEILKKDPLFALLSGAEDLSGEKRKRARDKGKPLAGKSTLNRLELSPTKGHRGKNILCNDQKVESLFVEMFLKSYKNPPREIVLDLDNTDDPLYGKQEGRCFQGYYKIHCYLPLYIFCGEQLLCAKLNTAEREGASGAKEELERIINQIKREWPEVRIIVRGDSGFCRDKIMNWCEENEVWFVIGLGKNSRLTERIRKPLEKVRRNFLSKKGGTKIYRNFNYRTRSSWARKRRVVGKMEHLEKRSSHRFIVTNIPKEVYGGKGLYEFYCGRGDMENRIKEQQMALFADRTSSKELAANQLRLWFASMAYVLISALRRKGLQGTEWAKAQCDTIRLKMFKIGAFVKISCRRIYIQMSSAYPYQELFMQTVHKLKE